jgi:Restriction endonuclease
VLVSLGRFSDDAREAARDAPVDLIDGDDLAALVKKHLPQAWATRTV